MKNNAKLILFSMFISWLSLVPIAAKSFSYTFSIQFPPQTLPELRCYYKGEPIDLHDGWAMIFDRQECLTFSLIFIQPDEIFYDRDTTGVKCFKRSAQAPCAWYDITKNIGDKGSVLWHIEKKDAKNLPLRFPQNSIIILMHPRYVEKIVQPITQTHDASSVIHLPRVILKQKLSATELVQFQEHAVSCLMGALDLDALHARPTHTIRQEKNSLQIVAKR